MIKPAPSSPRYLSCEEAGDYLRMSPRTLEKLRVVGGGPRFRKFGRRVLYAATDLDSWANDRICLSTSDAKYRDLCSKG
jgi:molybdenum cofactor biosynthesis enzyme MoaA